MIFTESTFYKQSENNENSFFRVNVQNGKDHGKIFAPFLIVEYDELTYQDFLNNSDVIIDYKVIFILKDNDIDYNVEVKKITAVEKKRLHALFYILFSLFILKTYFFFFR